MWSELYFRWNRLINALRWGGGMAIAGIVAGFAFSNRAEFDIHWWHFSVPAIQVWQVIAVALVAGFALGWFSQMPEMVHHFREAFRHRHRVRELEHELKELRLSLDKLLDMPDDARLTAGRGHAALAGRSHGEHDPVVAVLAADGAELDFPDPEQQSAARRGAPNAGIKTAAKAARPRRRPAVAARARASNGREKTDKVDRKVLLQPLAEELKAIKVPAKAVPGNGRSPRRPRAAPARPEPGLN